MITISLRNPPSKAVLWLPVFRVGGVGGNVHYPSHNLNLDESWQVDLDGHLDFRVDILDSANRLLDQTWFIPYTINDGRTYIYDWNTKQLLEATAGTRYYLPIAEGDSFQELLDNAQGKYVQDDFRLVIKTKNAPSWVLSSLTWLMNALVKPLNTVGVTIEEAEVVGNTINVYMKKGSPIHLLILVGIITVGLVLITFYISHILIEQEITEQQKIALETVETTQEMVNTVLDDPTLTPEVKDTIVAKILDLARAGLTPTIKTNKGIDWEKYLKWGMIGGGVILGAAVLIPAFIKR